MALVLGNSMHDRLVLLLKHFIAADGRAAIKL